MLNIVISKHLNHKINYNISINILAKLLIQIVRSTGLKAGVFYFETFRSKCFIHNNSKENLGKFNLRSDEGIFTGYSFISKSYHVYNKCIKVFEESISVIFDETNNGLASSSSFDDF